MSCNWRVRVLSASGEQRAAKCFGSREQAIDWARNAIDVATRMGEQVAVNVAPVVAGPVQCFATGDEIGPYPCVADPHIRWNGWACPRFTWAVVEQIARDTQQELTKRGDGAATIVFDELNATEITRGSDGLWEFDGWCWSIQDAEGNTL